MRDTGIRKRLETAKNTGVAVKDFYRSMSERKEELNSAVKKHEKNMKQVGEEYNRDIKNLIKETEKNFSDNKGVEKELKGLGEIGQKQKKKRDESTETSELKRKQYETEKDALKNHLDGIIKKYDSNGNKKTWRNRTWKEWGEQKAKVYWREMLEGQNKRMIGQLERYGQGNDRCIRNVSALTDADLQKYAQDRKNELVDATELNQYANFSLSAARDDLLEQHEEWQKGEEVSKTFSDLMKGVWQRGKENLLLNANLTDSQITLVDGDGSALYKNKNDSETTLVNKKRSRPKKILGIGKGDKEFSFSYSDEKRLKKAKRGSAGKGVEGSIKLWFRTSILGRDNVGKRIKREKMDIISRVMDRVDSDPESIKDEFKSKFDFLNHKEKLNKYETEIKKEEKRQYKVEKWLEKSYARSHKLGLRKEGTFATNSGWPDKLIKKYVYYNARLGIEKLMRMGLRRQNEKLTESIKELRKNFKSDVGKVEKLPLDDLLDKYPTAKEWLNQPDNAKFKLLFENLPPAAKLGPDQGKDLRLRNDFKPKGNYRSIERKVKEQYGMLPFPIGTKDERENYYQTLATGVEQYWKYNIGNGQKSWGKNRIEESALDIQRDLQEASFYDQRVKVLSEIEAGLVKDGNKFKFVEAKYKDTTKMMEEMKKYKEEALVLNEKIENEVKEEYQRIQKEYPDYDTLMQRAQKSSRDSDLGTLNPNPLNSEQVEGGINGIADQNIQSSTNMRWNANQDSQGSKNEHKVLKNFRRGNEIVLTEVINCGEKEWRKREQEGKDK